MTLGFRYHILWTHFQVKRYIADISSSVKLNMVDYLFLISNSLEKNKLPMKFNQFS